MKEVSESWIVQNSDLNVEQIKYSPNLNTIKPKVQLILNDYPLGATAFNNAFDFGFLENRGFVFPCKLPCPMMLSTEICKLQSPRGGYKWRFLRLLHATQCKIIHAAKQGIWRYLNPKHNLNTLPTSAIIGKATLVDCVQNHDSVWAERLNDQVLGEFYEKPIWNWVLEAAVLFDKPILNVKGKLSFWDFNI